ncbi:hypothetical protein JTB14_010648 [Gonioctena quinquepunctata]|nr:hypothetical protein JTB14_010648 [Gonioctena quinquepunctata]
MDHDNITHLIVEKSPGVYEVEDLTKPIPHYVAKQSDIIFHFSSRIKSSPIEIDIKDPKAIERSSYSLRKDTYFIIHGWLANIDSVMEVEICDAILKAKDANVFLVDWSNIAKRTYLESFAAVPDIGRLLGESLYGLAVNNSLDLERTTIVGHSLGAHIAGRAGADLKGQIGVIVGLDPAGPLFFHAITSNRLDPTDAKFVQVIHSCAFFLGFRKPLGHADYYPNGGEIQPSCRLDITGSCSHGMSYEYYTESILTGGFKAKSCDSYNDYKKEKCEENESSEMGTISLDQKANGSYFLTTNNKPLYARR